MLGRGKTSNPTALGHRQHNRNVAGFDYFYAPTTLEVGTLDSLVPQSTPRSVGHEWLAGIVDEAMDDPKTGKMGKFCSQDRRYLYAPWSPKDDIDVNLDDEWKYYFDDKETYDRVLATKLRLDPTHVFTPNMFSVGINDKLKKKIEK